jgi:DMSO/TMAO reductase YedYZ molybdopterin-dependent catalytic subunit
MKVPGPGFAGYGQPSPFESRVVKVFLPPPATQGVGASRTPLQLLARQARPLNVTAIHGLLGCSGWTGARLSTLFDEAGFEPEARWVIAEGADAAAMSRRIPLAKAMDDALVFLYQNGERVR